MRRAAASWARWYSQEHASRPAACGGSGQSTRPLVADAPSVPRALTRSSDPIAPHLAPRPGVTDVSGRGHRPPSALRLASRLTGVYAEEDRWRRGGGRREHDDEQVVTPEAQHPGRLRGRPGGAGGSRRGGEPPGRGSGGHGWGSTKCRIQRGEHECASADWRADKRSCWRCQRDTRHPPGGRRRISLPPLERDASVPG